MSGEDHSKNGNNGLVQQLKPQQPASQEMVKKKSALITGIRGQDGAYLAMHLLNRGYIVTGADRRSGNSDTWRLAALGIEKDVEIKYMDLQEDENIRVVIGETDPDLIFNLAAQSFVGVSFDQPILTHRVNGMGAVTVLSAVRSLQLVREMMGADVRFYQASTSEMFGNTPEPATEDTPFHPQSPYGVAKLTAHWATRQYRETYQLFACSGILFNHESPLRGNEFVTRKITRSVARMYCEKHDGAKGEPEILELGNLDSRRDWGHAFDYTEAMVRMLEHDQPADYVVASGETHSVRDFVELCVVQALETDIEWRGEDTDEVGLVEGVERVRINPKFYRPNDVTILQGNPSKIGATLGWERKYSFADLVVEMVEADIEKTERDW